MAKKRAVARTPASAAGAPHAPSQVTEAMLLAIDIGAYLLEARDDLDQGDYEAANRIFANAVQHLDALVVLLRQCEHHYRTAVELPPDGPGSD